MTNAMASALPIYLDHNATTPPAPEVVEAMLPFLSGAFGNPSSIHRHGVDARYAVEKARRRLAKFIAAKPEEIVFTSGGTEADNIAIRGAAHAARAAGRGTHLITSAAEHKAVLDTCHALEGEGFELTILSVDGWGRVRPEELDEALTDKTCLVSLMAANNEVGSVNPLPELISVVRRNSAALFHADAVQALGRIPLNLGRLDADLLSFAAHKLYGPKGVGALFVRGGTTLHAPSTGGGQEFRTRPGTENVPGIVGFAEAVRLAEEAQPAENQRLLGLREDLWEDLSTTVGGILRNTPPEDSLAGTLNVSVLGTDGRGMVRVLDEMGFAISSGSACSSTGVSKSHVLSAMFSDVERVRGAIRISLGRGTTRDDVRAFVAAFPSAARRAREEVCEAMDSGTGKDASPLR